MLKPLMLGGAMLLAIPALAQTTGSDSSVQSGTSTTTNDHDPMMEDGTMGTGTADANVSTQVNSGTTTTTGAAVGTQGSADQGMGQGMGQGTMTGQTGASGTMSTPGQGSAGWSGTAASGTGTYTGVGGPSAPRDYPRCSATVRDSCTQVPGRRSRR